MKLESSATVFFHPARRAAGLDGLRDLTPTTNGYLLAKQAHPLAGVGLRHITMSLDSHDKEVLRRMSGRPFGPDRECEGIDAAAQAGLSPIEINCLARARSAASGEVR